MENGSAGAASPADDDSQDATKKNITGKRKVNGDGLIRAKRNRYISIAWYALPSLDRKSFEMTDMIFQQ